MAEEGYIKFILEWVLAPVPPDFDPSGLLTTRNALFSMGLIGYDEKEKVGFGNISQRYSGDEFIISGTQTGHIPKLNAGHLSWIRKADIERNRILALGPAKPSSEALTHAAIYKDFPATGAVIHIHSARFWHYYRDKLPATSPLIPYGTREMADAVRQLDFSLLPAGCRIFIMGGHQDGVISFGSGLSQAFSALQELYFGMPGK